MKLLRWVYRGATVLSAVVLPALLFMAIAGRAWPRLGAVPLGGQSFVAVSDRKVRLCCVAPWPLRVGPPYVPLDRRTDMDMHLAQQWSDTHRRLTRDWECPVLGFTWFPKTEKSSGRWVVDGTYCFVWSPDWVVIPTAAALPLGWAVGVARRRRRAARNAAAGLCPACGYDLRIHSGRCPECGTPVTERSARHNHG